MMNPTEIKELINGHLGDGLAKVENEAYLQAQVVIPVGMLEQVLSLLHRNANTYFDLLSSVSAVDNGAKAGTMEIFYHLASIPYNLQQCLKIVISRDVSLPENVVPSASNIYKTALWHEREIYDLFGIRFSNHPDMRRIFLPVDWEGFPLRKDYLQQAYYRGIKVDY